MGIKHGYSFQRVYEDYLAWFHEKAVAAAKPKDKEVVLGCQMGHEDVYEDDSILLNHMFFFIPLLPSESKSGELEIFIIEELNLMKRSDGSSNDFDELTSVEYKGHAFSR